jgi:hypothetical protein
LSTSDGLDGLHVLLVTLGTLTLVALHTFERGASKAECLAVDRRYQELTHAAGRQPSGEPPSRLDACIRGVSRRQATCAANAEDLDRLEECFF